MKELVEVLAKSLVDHPEDVCVKEVINGRQITYQLSVSEQDMGKVIGKQGRIAKSIRTIVNSAAIKDNKRVTVEIV